MAQQLLGARHARTSHVLAQCAAEVPVKLAADLHRVPADRASDRLQCEARGELFAQLLADAQHPGGRAPALRAPGRLAGEEQLQRHSFDVELRELIAHEELVVQPCAQGARARIVDFAREL